MVLKLFNACYSLFCLFENDVEMYGAQTYHRGRRTNIMFENDVEMYGAQTPTDRQIKKPGLRMM